MTFPSSIPGLLIFVAAAASLPAQTVPATAPTVPTAQVAQQYVPAAEPQAERRAQVSMLPNGTLTVSADNSSLNQILREISRVTGMKITGGVNDERVFGTYGPADTSTVLTSLLRGTGSNMLLVFDSHQAPAELVLTPRNGGATPPSPNAGHEHDEDDRRPQGMPRASRGAEPSDPRPQQPIRQTQTMQQPAATQAEPNSIPLPTPPPPDATTQTSPNGVPTPQQIYDQLMQNRAKQQQQQQKLTPATPPQ